MCQLLLREILERQLAAQRAVEALEVAARQHARGAR